MAAIHNMVIEKGSDFSKELNITSDDASFDFTEHDYKASIRRDQDDTTAMATFVIVESNAGQLVTLTLSETVTAGMTAGHAFWDLLQINSTSGDRQRILEGEVVVSPRTTRETD